MKIPPAISKITNLIFDKCANDIGSTLIWTTIIGWLASSASQIIGIAANSKYTKEEKLFMIPQEVGDALINIITYCLITTPIKKLSTKLVKTGKILPRTVKDIAKINGDNSKLGKLNFDITKADYFPVVEKTFNSFHNFVGTTAAIIGGIVSTNIITPNLRNIYAAKRQTKMLEAIKNTKILEFETIKSTPVYKSNINSTFNQFRHNSISI